MELLFSLYAPLPYLEFPQGLLGWAGWVLFLATAGYLLWRWRGYNSPLGKKERNIAIALVIAAPLTSLLVGIRLPGVGALPLPDVPAEPLGPAAMVFSALPWVFAAGLLGPIPAAAIALISGITQALWDTHSLFTPIELVILATLLSVAIRQRYRTLAYRLARHPLFSALVVSLLYPLLFLASSLCIARGALVSRLDYALSHLGSVGLAQGAELLVAGLFAEILTLTMPGIWGQSKETFPSPSEKSIRARFLYNMAPLAFILILGLMIGDWLVAENAARQMLENRLENIAETATTGIPYFLDAGQNLIQQMAADSRLYSASESELPQILAENIKTVPYFRQLYVLDKQGYPLAGYPQDDYTEQTMPLQEKIGSQLALSGVPVQFYTLAPAEDDISARISFIAAITGGNNEVEGILIGHSDLATNPLCQPVIAGLNSLTLDGGQGILLDENGTILFHPDPLQLMTKYSGRTGPEAGFFDDTAPDGTRSLVYYKKTVGRPWSIVLVAPAHLAQEIALHIAAPLLGLVLLLALIAVFILNFGLKTITSSLHSLAAEAELISRGQLDHSLPVNGEDEIGHLGRAFEQMRVKLRARLEDLNRLLIVSQGVASNLELEQALQPVLEAALASGACLARVSLLPSVVPELNSDDAHPPTFSMGSARDVYHDLDEQILQHTRQQEKLALPNLLRPKLLNLAPGSPRPESLLAVAIRYENVYYGVLWIAFDKPHQFSDEETRFVTTLAGQATLAITNARLFLRSEVGRQRLAAILASTPDPILVTDQRHRLILANPAAWQVLGITVDTEIGQPLEKVITQKEMLDLLGTPSSKELSAEINLPGGQVYLATASPVLAEGQPVGRICILRDITRIKALDAMKSEFVSTVSHDLRSPLTLMRGYTTMLEMVGQLNEQQTSYVQRILTNIEIISKLVNNLLDLGRIDAGVGLEPELVPAREVIERVISGLQAQATQKHITLEVQAPDDKATVEADAALLQQALHNLVENAIKYTRNEGKVTIRLTQEEDRMQFEVSDTGIGIAPMDQMRIFEKFFRGAQQIPKEQRGTGLGLAIVKSIAERHGGQVWVESQLGKGSTFFIDIPMRQPEKEKPEDG